MGYKFATVLPQNTLNSIVKNFFAIEFDKDTTHTDYLLPDGLPSFFYIETASPIDAYFGQTVEPVRVWNGLYLGYSNTVVKFAHQRLKIVGASVFPVYLNLIFHKSPLDIINKFSRLEISAFKPVESLLSSPGDSFRAVFALFETYIAHQLMRHEFNQDFLVVYKKLTSPDGYYTTVEELAAYMGYSTRYLHSRFRKFFGMSPKRLMKLIRFNHALKYIYDMEGRKSLSYIAHEVGYHDQSHFIRDFREICGKTPKQIAGDSDSLAKKFRLF